ncbi:MAG TPA: tetratricopeptide repeat protein, partial [Anaerolineae bacterium]|nr:tetratricopeptide repeat protein [Anaerolineae bacterium]
EAMFQRTRGQPLFTVELLRALQEQGDLTQDGAGRWVAVSGLDWDILPARVEAVIARRVDRLPTELRDLLAVASVEGETFSAEVVAQVQGLALRPLLHKLSQELDRRYRLVREQGEMVLEGRPISRYQFRHNLFQQYLYQQLGVAERRHLHGQVAAALEQIGGGDLGGLAVSLSHHYLAAGDAGRAVPYLCRAGDEALRRVALEEAVQLYRSALAHWPAAESRDDAAARAGTLHRLGESLLAMGKSQEAIDSLAAAEVLYARAGDRAGVGAMHRLIGRSYWEQGARSGALHHYHRALAILEQEPESAELARATSAISQMHVLADELDEAAAWGERALALARRLDAQDVVVHALTNVALSIVARGQVEQGLAMLAESRERAEALGLPHDTCRAYAGLSDALIGVERYEEARSSYERLLAYARKVHAEFFEGVAVVQLGYLDWWTGRWGAAWARRQAIQELLALGGVPSIARIWGSTLLATMFNDLGLPEQARGMLQPFTEVARSADELQTTVPHLGQLARTVESEEERAGLMQEMLALIDRAAYLRYDVLPALRLTGTWLAETSGGDRSSLGRLEKAHGQMQGRQSAACVYEVQALAAGLRGEWTQAVAGYEAAAANWETLQRPYDLLRAWAGLAQALAHTGDRAAGAAVRQRAAPWIERLAAELSDPATRQAFLALQWIVELRGR